MQSIVKGNGRKEVHEALKKEPKESAVQRRQKSLPDHPMTISDNSLDEYQYMIEILGTSTLICHSKKGVNFADEGKLPKGKSKPPFDAIGSFKNSFYMLPGAKTPSAPIQPNGFWKYFPNTFGHPAKAFKDALISMALQETQLHKDILGTRMRAIGTGKDPNLVVLKYGKVRARYEYLPNPSSFPKTLMPVCRAEFFDWSTKIIMKVSARLFQPKDFGRLLALAGEWIGVGDSRIEKSKYDHGTFTLGKVVATKIEHPQIGLE